MSSRSIALFSCLVDDLAPFVSPVSPVPGFSFRDLEGDDSSVRRVASLALMDTIFKKYVDGDTKAADDLALSKFLKCNAQCERFLAIDRSGISQLEDIALGEFKDSIYRFFTLSYDRPLLTAERISQHIAVGPGASVGTSGNSFYHKIGASRMTGTLPSLFSLYKREISKYSLWDETEKIRSDHFGCFTEVEGSRLSFAPKSSEVSRTICTEPLLNMLFQKGIGSILESRLRDRHGINLSVQPSKNQALARVGSKYGTFGTIDLSSASDSISIGLLREVLPKTAMSWLMETRSPGVKLPSGCFLPLHMVSSMGNGFTFPLQTILFSSVVAGAYCALGIKVDNPRGTKAGNWAVFGDDIIVRREAYDLVVNLLQRLGFSVNTLKSYNVGPFRESCGSDFWNGFNVRGVYCRALETKQDLYSLVNRLNVWSANQKICLTSCVEKLLDWIGVLNPVPPWESDIAGVKVPLGMLTHSRTRKCKWTGSIVYSRYLPKPDEISLIDLESRPLTDRMKFKNHPAVLLSAVGGYLRDGKILFRKDISYYTKRLAIAPCWDYIHPCHSPFTSDGWQRWKDIFVRANFGRRTLYKA